MSGEEQPKCPVDHSAREVWLKQQKNSEVQAPHPIPSGSGTGDKCPVDHEARAKWASLSSASGPGMKVDGSKIATAVESCSSSEIPEQPVLQSDVDLPVEREISSIPRTGTNGKWVYPSEKQFFEAMKRKNWNPEAADMQTVVPIHNAVNERAWYQILKWEEGQGGDSCGGIKLTSFKGDSKKLTPKARIKLFLGYQRPFDRHDWVIDRCGKEIEYVIDFYSGKPNPINPNVASFYLDVRPKLNTFEGIKLRIVKFFGF